NSRGNDAAVDAASFIRGPVEDVRRGHHLHAGLGEGLALLKNHRHRDLLAALPHQVCGLAKDLRPLIGGEGPPGCEGTSRRFSSRIDVVGRRVRDLRKNVACRRVQDIFKMPGAGIDPVSVDEKLQRRIALVPCHGSSPSAHGAAIQSFTNKASKAIAPSPSGPTMSGLMSTSAIAGSDSMSAPSRTTASATAATSRGACPRNGP